VRGLLVWISAAALNNAGCQLKPTSPPAPTAGNNTPTIVSLIVTPAFGVSGLTVISLSATAVDPDQDGLT
jgi:hypothetical protein